MIAVIKQSSQPKSRSSLVIRFPKDFLNEFNSKEIVYQHTPDSIWITKPTLNSTNFYKIARTNKSSGTSSIPYFDDPEGEYNIERLNEDVWEMIKK